MNRTMVDEKEASILFEVVERGAKCLASMRVARELGYGMIIGGATDEQKDRDGYAEDLAIAAIVAASRYGKSAEYVRSKIDYYQDRLLGF